MNAYDAKGDKRRNLKGAVDENGNQIWTDSEGRLHRLDGAALISQTATECWFHHGIRHREDGPSLSTHGSLDIHQWWIKDKEMSKDQWIQWLKDGKSSLDKKTVLRLILENS
jgi:hypothetical protein